MLQNILILFTFISGSCFTAEHKIVLKSINRLLYRVNGTADGLFYSKPFFNCAFSSFLLSSMNSG